LVEQILSPLFIDFVSTCPLIHPSLSAGQPCNSIYFHQFHFSGYRRKYLREIVVDYGRSDWIKDDSEFGDLELESIDRNMRIDFVRIEGHVKHMQSQNF